MIRFFMLIALLTITAPMAAQDRILLRQDVELNRPGAPATLHATLEWGTLTVRGHDAPVMRIEMVEPAHERARGTGGGRAELVVGEQGNVVTVRPTENPSRRFESAYVTVYVPQQTTLKLTMNRGGEVAVHDLVGEMEISNANGSVHLENVGGTAVVDAVNGEIVGRLNRVDPVDMWFTSLNGQVDLTMPGDLSVDVLMSTGNGRIISDYEVDQETPQMTLLAPGSSSVLSTSTLAGRINGGGPTLRLSTRSGDVVLRRSRNDP